MKNHSLSSTDEMKNVILMGNMSLFEYVDL